MKPELNGSITRCAILNWDGLGMGDSGQFNFPVTLLETLHDVFAHIRPSDNSQE